MLDAVCCDATNKQFRLSAYAATSYEDVQLPLAKLRLARVQSLRKTQNKKQGYRMVSYKLRGLDTVCCDATNKQFRLSAYAATSCEDRSIALSEPSVRAGSSHRVVGAIKR